VRGRGGRQPAKVGDLQQGHDQQEPGVGEIEEFMSVAAHDLRNPIAVVRASAQMAQRQMARGDPEGALGRLKAIVEQTDRLTDMLDIFLDAARVSTGRLVLRSEQVDLREVVKIAAQRARLQLAEHADRVLECTIPDGCVGTWDKPKITRAVRALVSNAMLYGDPAAPVSVETRRIGNRVYVTFSGGGPGPEPEEAARLFERFYRGPSAAEAGQSGSGLGLFTARGIARSHGGEVRYLDGDRFELELPLTE
jgi:two-component system, OmpR family, sensor kinase